MITNFKLFESIEELKIEKGSYWIIYGSLSHCFNILKKMQVDYRLEYELQYVLESMNEDILSDKYIIIGTAIFYNLSELDSFFQYGSFETVAEKNEILQDMLEYNFKGEIKKIDNKIVVDTFEVDVNKYNL